MPKHPRRHKKRGESSLMIQVSELDSFSRLFVLTTCSFNLQVVLLIFIEFSCGVLEGDKLLSSFHAPEAWRSQTVSQLQAISIIPRISMMSSSADVLNRRFCRKLLKWFRVASSSEHGAVHKLSQIEDIARVDASP
jgi:hypothetical protein